jgi:hypothetical protein
MRQFIIAATAAVGLIALWAAMLPLTAQPLSKQSTATTPSSSSALTEALFLCHGRNALDQVCVAALSKALALDAGADASSRVNDKRCHVDQTVLARLGRN